MSQGEMKKPIESQLAEAKEQEQKEKCPKGSQHEWGIAYTYIHITDKGVVNWVCKKCGETKIEEKEKCPDTQHEYRIFYGKTKKSDKWACVKCGAVWEEKKEYPIAPRTEVKDNQEECPQGG